ncbi:MAG: hypothetical protein GY850_07805, partial [bacterium]|nr:hypothetical protein [bacterium]
PRTGEFLKIGRDEQDPYSISSAAIGATFEDPDTGLVYIINSWGNTIDVYDPAGMKFTLYRHDPDNPDNLKFSATGITFEDSKGRVWIATIGAMELFDRSTEKFTHFVHNSEDPNSLQGAYVAAFAETRDGMLWLLCQGGVLTKFDPETKQVMRHYAHDPNDPDSLMALDTSAGGYIVVDKDDPDILWLAVSNGLEKFDVRSGKATHYVHDPADPESIAPGIIWHIYQDMETGMLWLSCRNGLSIFDKQTGKAENFYQNLDDPEAMHVHDNSFVFQDSFRNMWICGFQSGMDKFDPIKKTFTHFNTGNGFPAGGINISITEDDHENLWIGSFNGLIKFNIPAEKVLAVYTESDGLGHNHIWRGSELRDGQMWFGGQNGLNTFYPDDIKENPYAPPIVLTKFLQSGQEVNLGTAYERVTDITLDWQSNFFEFQFAALNYIKPEKNQYAYMLEG